MVLERFGRTIRLTLWLGLLLCFTPGSRADTDQVGETGVIRGEKTLVLVNIISETKGAQEFYLYNGRRLENYRPRIINMFRSTGVVLDDLGHVLTFLGYRWVDLHVPNLRVEITTAQGRKLKARMIGIDQSLGVAVVLCEEGNLPKTPLCVRCEVRPDETVLIPAVKGTQVAQFESAQVMSVAAALGGFGRGGWSVTINPGDSGAAPPVLASRKDLLGLAILNARQEVLGFLASQQPSSADPLGLITTLYVMPQLLTSAERILKTGGDVSTGWLGVYIDDLNRPAGTGIRIKDLHVGGPAQKAGLLPGDVLLSYNDTNVADYLQFIRMVQDTAVGSEVEIGLLRDGRPLRVTARIEARQPRQIREKIVFGIPPDVIQVQPELDYGLECVPVTPKLAEVLQLPVHQGLLVSNVMEARPFAQAGIQVGDVILSTDKRRFSDPRGFFGYLRDHGPGGQLTVTVLRKGAERSIVVNFP